MKNLARVMRCPQRMLMLMLLGLAVSGPLRAGPLPWTDSPYSYYAQDIPVTQALIEFADGFSLALQVSSGVTGKVNGRFATKNPAEFLDQLASVYGLVWFTHGGTLYITRTSENITKSLPASASNIGTLKQALTDIGVLERRFGWGELADQAVAIVSGPPAYVRLIEDTINKLPQVAGGQQTAIFRLKYASVTDRTISFRSSSIITPGVATIVGNLMRAGGTSDGVSDGDRVQAVIGAGSGSSEGSVSLSGLGAPLRVIPPLVDPAGGASAGEAPRRASPVARGNARVRASVQADQRLNALIVQDAPERIPIWAELIAKLDVPTALIEIEAMIIDVNTQNLEELGINWGARFGNVEASYNSGNFQISASSGGVNATTLLVDAGNFLMARIRALEGVGNARIQSRPSILTIDNVGAVIDLSETFYVRTTGERVATVTPITTGTTLRVTPHYVESNGERLVQLVIDIEDGKIQDRQIDQLPTVSRSTVSTQAIVNENQTLLIGGYNTDQDMERTDRVPFLGSLPGIGGLFSNRSKDVQKRERLFLIKPKLITVPVETVERLMGSVPANATSNSPGNVSQSRPVLPAPRNQ